MSLALALLFASAPELEKVGGDSGVEVPAPKDWAVNIKTPAGDAPKMLASLERLCSGKGDIGTVYVQVGKAGQSAKQLLEKIGAPAKKGETKAGWLCVTWSDHEAVCGGTVKKGQPPVSIYLAAGDAATFAAAGGMDTVKAIAQGLKLSVKGFADVKPFERAGGQSCP